MLMERKRSELRFFATLRGGRIRSRCLLLRCRLCSCYRWPFGYRLRPPTPRLALSSLSPLLGWSCTNGVCARASGNVGANYGQNAKITGA